MRVMSCNVLNGGRDHGFDQPVTVAGIHLSLLSPAPATGYRVVDEERAHTAGDHLPVLVDLDLDLDPAALTSA